MADYLPVPDEIAETGGCDTAREPPVPRFFRPAPGVPKRAKLPVDEALKILSRLRNLV